MARIISPVLVLLLATVLTVAPSEAAVTFRSAASASSASSTPTRFYMQNAAPDVTVATHRGAWDVTGSVLQRKLARTKSGAIATKAVAEASATNNYDVLMLKFVSEPITAAQTITGTLNWIVGDQESSNNMNANWHVHAYVTQGDTDNLRGTLITDYTEAAGTNEWPTTAVGDTPNGAAAVALSSVAVSANDRIVIEAGYVARNSVTTNYTGTLWYGGTSATDLTAGGDETSFPGWWEFSQDLFSVSALTIPKPAGTLTADVMIASISVTPSTITITPPVGWTLISTVTQSSATTSKLVTYYRVAGVGEPASYSWGFSGGTHNGAVGGIASFSGVDNLAPIDAQAGTPTVSATSHTAPSVTTTQSNGMLVTVHEYASSGTWTQPGTMTEALDVASLTPNNASGISMEMNYETRPTAGATGTRQANASTTADSGATQSVALKAAPLVCYTDNFNRANGSPGSDWVVSSTSGGFGNPVIVNNRLRLTDATGNVATMATLQRLFPGSGNRIEVDFDHFAYGFSGCAADGIAVTLSDSAVTPVPGGYGGSLGYAQRTGINGFAGGWLGIGIDEYGNFSNPTEGRSGGPGFRVDSVAVRGSGSGTTGYAYHAGTNTLTPQVDNNGAAVPPHHYRIIVDHSNGVNAMVSVERDTGAGYVTLVAPYDAKAQAGQAAVPTGWLLSYTGSTGGCNNIHEIDSLQVCATSQTSMTGIHHFDITVGPSASTCSPQSVTIVARDISNNILTGYTGTVQITTSTSHGDWSKVSAGGTLTNGTADDGVATYTFVAGDNGIITLGFTNTHADDLTFNVTDVAVPSSSTTSSVTTSFRDSAFVITPDTIQIAGRNQNMTVALYTKVGGSCTPDTNYTGARTLDAWLTLDPSHPAGATVPTIGALTLPTSAPASNPASNNLTLTFTAGVASFALATTDVGRYVLNMRDDTRTYATAVDLGGASSSITTRPWLHVAVSGNPGASAATGTVFTSAGTDFSATVRGVLWQAADDANNDGIPDSGANLVDNTAAPRFAWDTVLSPTIPFTPATPSDAPAGTGTAGTLTRGSGGSTVTQASFSSGSATVTDWRYSEVGSFTLRATASNYLNSGINVATDNGVVGRFTPAYFDVARIHGCPVGADPLLFTYSGQPFTVTATARAANSGAVTLNYDGTLGFAKATTISDAGNAANFTNNVLAAANFSAGTRTQSTVTYTFPAKETAPATLTLRAVDTDSVSSAGHTEEQTQIRSGRVHIYNAYGSELVDLLVSTRVEYYEDTTVTAPATIPPITGWIANGGDSCSSVGLSALSNFQGNLASGETCVQDTGSPGVSGQGCAAAGPLAPVNERYLALPSAGDYNLYLKAPGATNDGSVDVTANLATKTWLRYDWNGTGSDVDPTGQATFGLYRGSPKHIYLRQRYN
ncbi:MAG: hypothetical protein HY274_05445 [Gammaproteobacteria bacterium]|nr:hypothetical protein [Gammaproteobacteria bacterium]